MMSLIAILQPLRWGHPTDCARVHNHTVNQYRNKSGEGRAQSPPSWRGLRLANMPMQLWIVLLALLVGGFVAILLHR